MNHIYILYRITNKVNKNFYIGVHKTKDIHDNYWGSGHAIKAAIQKYGLENFKKEIIQVFSNKKNAYNEESKIVNENMLKNKKCYNLKDEETITMDSYVNVVQEKKRVIVRQLYQEA